MRGVAAGLLTLLAGAGAVSANERSRQLAAACAACHNPDVRDRAIPSIAGMAADRLTDIMIAYRSGARVNQIMQVVAGNLSDDEIVEVARVIAAQPMGAPKP